MQKGPRLPGRKIGRILFPGVCLFFKAHLAIRGVHIAMTTQVITPLDKIPNIEGKDQQFELLTKVYAFMIHKHPIFFEINTFKNDEWPQGQPHVFLLEDIFKNQNHKRYDSV